MSTTTVSKGASAGGGRTHVTLESESGAHDSAIPRQPLTPRVVALAAAPRKSRRLKCFAIPIPVRFQAPRVDTSSQVITTAFTESFHSDGHEPGTRRTIQRPRLERWDRVEISRVMSIRPFHVAAFTAFV